MIHNCYILILIMVFYNILRFLKYTFIDRLANDVTNHTVFS